MAGDHTRSDFSRLRASLDEIQAALRELGLDGWLLYDLHARNSVAAGLLGLGDLTRRYFVLVPAEGEPEAVVHGIEELPWTEWPWRRHVYVGWKPLGETLGGLLGGRRVAMEYSPRDAVPAVDLVPAGVVDLVREAGAEVVSSGELITRFYSRWSEAGLASHVRAAEILARTARDAMERLAHLVHQGSDEATEGAMRDWIVARLVDQGCGVGADCIMARGPNAANPHYAPVGAGERFVAGDVVLLDLWAKERDDAVFADQTWMGYLGDRVPERVQELWRAIRDARDAAVAFIVDRWQRGELVQGWEVDDVCRGLVRERGWADRFIHRTGHSIDRDTHGMGPNIDNLETRETRRLVPGVGFSIEPGIYLPDDVGLRTEIDVYMSEDGPRVTTPDPQREIFTLLPPR